MEKAHALHYHLGLKRKSRLSYQSYIGIFVEYLKENDLADINISDFTKAKAIKYLDYMFMKKKLTNTTRNNYLRHMAAIFSKLEEREYISKNPFVGIKKYKEAEKKTKEYIA